MNASSSQLSHFREKQKSRKSKQREFDSGNLSDRMWQPKKFHNKTRKFHSFKSLIDFRMFSLSRLALRRSLPVLQRLAVTRTFVTRPIAVNFCTKPHSDILGQLDKKIQMQYTCKVCNTRNSQTMSNVAYTKGVVIVTCSGCKNNHLVAE